MFMICVFKYIYSKGGYALIMLCDLMSQEAKVVECNQAEQTIQIQILAPDTSSEVSNTLQTVS